jgi:Bacterial Ig-like domain (group 3)/IPT/TIG domain/Carboxypeptidase regulatory-like domain
VALGLVCAPLSAASAATLSGTISGKLPGQEVKPVAGAAVTVTPSGGGEVVGTTTTGAEGQYSLEVPDGVFDVRVVPKEGPLEVTSILKVEVSGSRRLDLLLVPGEVEPPQLVQLTGTVRDANGKVFPHVSVELSGGGHHYSATTASNGSYSISALPGAYTASLSWFPVVEGHAGVPSNGFSLSTTEFTLESNQERNVTLPPTAQVTVEALGRGNAPLQGSEVAIPDVKLEGGYDLGGFQAISIVGSDSYAFTDAAGRVSFFVFAGSTPPTARGSALPPSGAAYITTGFELPSVSDGTVVPVHLTEAIRLSGTVRDAQGNTLQGVSVSLSGEGRQASGGTGRNGVYSVVALPGHYTVTVSSTNILGGNPGMPENGFSIQAGSIDLESDQERNVTLPPTAQVTVEVENESGAPIAGAFVDIPETVSHEFDLGGFEAEKIAVPAQGAKTGADGRASIPVFTGSSRPIVPGTVGPPTGGEYGGAEFEVPAVGEVAHVVLPSKALVHLSGTLRDAQGQPIAFAVVSLHRGSEEIWTTTAKDGTYSLHAPPGHYHLEVEWGVASEPPKGSPGSGWDVRTTEFALESNQERDISLPPTSPLTVQVLGRGGAPLEGASVGVPQMSTGAYDLGGFEAEYAESNRQGGGAGVDGKVTFLVFTGSREAVHGQVEAPHESGYANAEFTVPEVDKETTVVVSLAGNGEEEDTEPPRLESLEFEPAEIDTAETSVPVTIVAHVIDEGSGFAAGHATFRTPGGGELLTSTEFVRVAGSETDGTYEAVATFPQGSEPGTWLIGSLDLSDQAGNELLLGPEQLNERELSYRVVVAAPVGPSMVAEISPSSGPESGGTKVHVTGSGFSGASAVKFGGSSAEFFVESDESLTAIAPPGVGTAAVSVTTPAGTSAESAADRFGYAPPVSLASSPNPSVRGQKVTFTAKVTPVTTGAPTPLGTVTFTEGTATLGVANLNKGTATLNTTTLGAGEHPVVAEYSGDAHFGLGRSPAVIQVVAKATTETTLTSGLDPAPFGATATLKASVKAVAPAAGTPLGTVTFSEGETVLAAVQLSTGNAILSLKSLPPGSHAITATYSGDANDNTSSAGPSTQTITKASTELSLSSTLDPAPYGSSATLKATVKAVAPGGGTPTGTVTFSEGETVLAIVPLSAGSAKYALKSTLPGAHEITATYSGDGDYEASGNVLGQTIVKASTELTLTSSKNPAPRGSTGTLKATVKALAPGGGTPTGTVTFREGETVLAIIPFSGNVATYPLKSLATGTHEITAEYQGSPTYEASEAVIVQVITS